MQISLKMLALSGRNSRWVINISQLTTGNCKESIYVEFANGRMELSASMVCWRWVHSFKNGSGFESKFAKKVFGLQILAVGHVTISISFSFNASLNDIVLSLIIIPAFYCIQYLFKQSVFTRASQDVFWPLKSQCYMILFFVWRKSRAHQLIF